eukprot:6035593-Lingulodinium_polyedra.AAC.1
MAATGAGHMRSGENKKTRRAPAQSGRRPPPRSALLICAHAHLHATQSTPTPTVSATQRAGHPRMMTLRRTNM